MIQVTHTYGLDREGLGDAIIISPDNCTAIRYVWLKRLAKEIFVVRASGMEGPGFPAHRFAAETTDLIRFVKSTHVIVPVYGFHLG